LVFEGCDFFRNVTLPNCDIFVSYIVFHRFRLTKQNDYFWVNFDHFWIEQYFWRQLGQYWNWPEPKTNSPSGNLACPNLWNALLLKCVPRIVALVIERPIARACPIVCGIHASPSISPFYKFLHVKNRVYQSNMQKNLY